MKHLDVILDCNEITNDAALAIAFSAARGVEGAVDFDRKTLSEGDAPVTDSLFSIVCHSIASRLTPYVAHFNFTEKTATIVLQVKENNEHKAAEVVTGLVRTAAVALMTAGWQRVTDPGEADAARAFAEDRLTAILTILYEPATHTARRPLFPF